MSIPDLPTSELGGHRGFPEPAAVISLRNATTFREVDEDGQPILIVTDGVTSVAFDSGLSGLSYGVVTAAGRLADAVADFARSITARWQELDGQIGWTPRPTSGRHRRNRRQLGARRRNVSLR
jgi:hypothetical protein